MPDQPLHRPRRGVAQRADGVPLDLLRQLLEHVNLLEPSVALLHPLHDGVEPPGTLAARGALPAGLVLVKVRQARDGVHDVRALVHDDHRRGAQTGLRRLERVEIHEHLLAHALGDQGHGRSAGDDRQQVIPPASHTAAVLLDQVLERDGHLFLHRARLVDVTRDAEELCARVVLATKRGEPIGAPSKDGGSDRDGLHVRDGRWAAVQADARGERGLEPGLALLPLQRLDERSLLSANVRAGSVVDVDVKVDAGAAGVLAEVARRVRLVARLHEREAFVDVLAADVDVAGSRAHSGARDEAALEELVGVVPHDLAIFARAGLGLVGVDDQVGGTTVADLFGFGKRAARRNVSGWTGVWRGESRNRTSRLVFDCLSLRTWVQ